MKKILCLVLAMCFLFCTACKNNTVKPSDAVTEGKDIKETTEITLYYPDKQGISLVSETRKVESDDKNHLAKKVVEKLIDGPQTDGLLTLIPDDTKLNAINVKDGLCTVDFSAEFINNSNSGSASETLLVYSVVNSLAELEDIDEVLFLIDGKTVEIFGNFIFDEPFEADNELNK